MPEKKTIEAARKSARGGKAPSTQAGNFVREEMDHIRERKHGARSTKQAVAIGLSKARRAGVKLAAPKKGTTSERTRKQAKRESPRGAPEPSAKPSPRRSRSTKRSLAREGRVAASRPALSGQKEAAKKRARPKGRRPARAGGAATR